MTENIPEALTSVHLLGGSSQHGLSYHFLEKVGEPFALLHLDHHPDMRESDSEDITGDNWLRKAFTSLENLQQVLMVGIDPDSELEILDFVFDGVLAVTDEDLRHCGDHLSTDVTEMISLLEPGIPVYVSIDTGVLAPGFARAGEGQGFMTPAQMRLILSEIAASHHIIAVDMCGVSTDPGLVSFLETL